MAKTYGQHCGLARALDRIGERWTLLIVRELLLGLARYTDLRKALPGMASNLLAERLRALEAEGLVARRRLPPPAATAVYELTELGRGLEDAVSALIRWGGHFMREPAEGDVLRPRWLVLAVRALTDAGDTGDLPLTCRIEVEGDAHTLEIAADGVRVMPAEGAPPAAVVLRTDPRTLLAIASGARPLAEAVAEGTARVEGGREAVAALDRIWRGTAAAVLS